MRSESVNRHQNISEKISYSNLVLPERITYGHIIQNALQGFHAFIKPAVKEHVEGRAANGMFIAVPEQLRNKCKDISPHHSRIQAILLETKEKSMMIINAYFPPDPKTGIYENDSELEDVLAAIENLVEAHQCNCMVLVGDLNCDYFRSQPNLLRLKRNNHRR